MVTRGMDKYSKIKQIGEGSFGKALLVRSKENGKQMVVKEINMMKMSHKEREEARKEVAVLAQLGHPNIVSYKESFEEIGNLYIVMDYCDGGDLYARINSQRGVLFSEDMILDWFVQCCLAIKHIHDRKILHRDIKSQNIFLTRHGIVKLGDFGIAKVLNSTVELARTCIGTPYYLSPEICENRPYNNKSDVWSLGCVLYELTTLKHAFEAGNMKNLVLKIIRGSYPPPSPRYTYDLRSLINSLFKRSARDRPSINTLLKKPLLQSRIRQFLSESEIATEFSHTVMHGVKIRKALPPGGARPLPPKPVPIQAKRAPQPVKYNPVSVYGPSVARKSKENRKSVEVKKSSEVRKSGGAQRKPNSAAAIAAANNDLVKKRQRLLEEERKRREDARKKDKDAAYGKQHRDLVEKQRVSRMNRAREDGWKNLLGADDSTESESAPTPKKDEQPRKAAPKEAAGGAGKYDHYHAYLDKMDQDRKAGAAAKPSGAGVRASRDNTPPVMGFNPGQAAKQGQAAGVKASVAAGKARDSEDYMAKKRRAAADEYMARRKAAAANKAKAHGDLFGKVGVAGAVSPRVSPAAAPYSKPSAARPLSAREVREKQEQEYLNKLKQIRLQNFNERRMQNERKAGMADPKYKPSVTPEKAEDQRRKKIEALRAQAEERARKLKEDLEKKRKEAYEHERKHLKQGGANKPRVSEKPAKPVPVTEVLKAIGAARDEPVSPPAKTPIGMTAAMQAIGAGPDNMPESPDDADNSGTSPLQKKKAGILKRLNAKPPVADKPDRGKWGQPVKPAVQPPSIWGDGHGQTLAGLALEETGSHMDATSAQDKVVKHLDYKEEPEDESSAVTPRRQWGRPGDTVVKALHQADISQTDGTILIKEGESTQVTPGGGKTVTIQEKKEDGEAEDKPKDVQASGITVGHVAGKGTVVIKKAVEETKEEQTLGSQSDAPDDATGEKKTITIESPSESDQSESPSSKETVATELEPPKQGDSKPRSALFDRVELDDEEETKSSEKQDTCLEDVGDEDNVENDAQTKKKEEEEEDRGQDEKKEFKKKMSSELLFLGLTTGHFDIDVKMLRTCSEPDLAKLFRTNAPENPFLGSQDDGVAASVDVAALQDELKKQLEHLGEEEEEEADEDLGSLEDLLPVTENGDDGEDTGSGAGEEEEEGKGEDDEEEEEGEGKEKSDSAEDSQETEESRDQEEDEDEDEDDDDDDGDSDEEDMRTLRESMMSILQTDDINEEEESLVTETKKKKKKSSKKVKKSKKKTRTAKEVDEGEDLTRGPIGAFGRQWSESSVEDLQTLRETMQSLLQPKQQGEPVKKSTLRPVPETSGGGDADSVDMANILAGTENWQSDDDDEDFFEEEDMFSRLEENRVKLEQELGCDTFLKAYKTVQAIHEDEDENMEEGIQLVSQILGPTKSHLYPSILQLVMADGVFTEDND